MLASCHEIFRGASLLNAGLLPQEYDAFVKRHPEVLESTKVPAEDTRAKARVLALLSLASQHNELGFAAIKVSQWKACFHPCWPLSGQSTPPAKCPARHACM